MDKTRPSRYKNKMELLVRYVSQDSVILHQIITSENPELQNATYRLFLHTGCCMQEFFNLTLQNELTVQGLGSIFRQPRTMNSIILDYFRDCGAKGLNNFNHIVTTIQTIANECKASHNSKNLRRAIDKILTYLEENLFLSDCCIDFCNKISEYINQPETANNIIGSFIFFHLICGQLFENLNNKKHLLPVSKFLNKISLGEADPILNQRFTSKIQKLLNQPITPNYGYQKKLPSVSFLVMRNIFLEKLSKPKVPLINLENLNRVRTLSPREDGLSRVRSDPPSSPRSLESPMSPRNMTRMTSEPIVSPRKSPLTERFRRHQLIDSIHRCQDIFGVLSQAALSETVYLETSGIKYFLLWTNQQIVELFESEKIAESSLFLKWQITGETFMDLTAINLELMGLTDSTEINKIIRLSQVIRSVAITNRNQLPTEQNQWSSQDLAIWLVLLDMSYLIPKLNGMTGEQFVNLTINDYCKLGIRPRDLSKLI